MIDTARAWFGAHRKLALAGLFLVAAVLLGLVLAYRGDYKGRYAVPTAGKDSALTMPPPPIPTPAPRPVLPPAPQPAMAPAPAPTVEMSDEMEDRAHDQRRIAKAIDHAVRKALHRGESVRWHKAGQEGFVMVSAPRDYPDRTCRNVTATMLDDHGETLSNAHLWCLFLDEEEWRPAS
jgi:hypothetical protein